jgi:endonuclease/exonuclease/phosphatase family metal-dependent hydrolase
LRNGELTGGTPVREFAVLLQEVRRAGSAVPAFIPPGVYLPKRLGPSDAVSIDTFAAEQKLNVFYAPAMRNGAGQEDRGNAILSTLPMADLAVLELPFERQRRIALLATLLRAGKPWLRVANLHLETRAGATRGGPAEARRRQAQAVIDALDATMLPLVVGGDLNTSWGDDEPAVRDLRRRYPDAGRTPKTTWAGPLGMSAKLDHIFARTAGPRLEIRRVGERFGSDHYPLLTFVDF